jgi:hypothetical protein
MGWSSWAGVDSFYTETYDEGTLYIAVVDPHTKRLIWIGAAAGRILPHISLEKRVERVDTAVAHILAAFPPS